MKVGLEEYCNYWIQWLYRLFIYASYLEVACLLFFKEIQKCSRKINDIQNRKIIKIEIWKLENLGFVIGRRLVTNSAILGSSKTKVPRTRKDCWDKIYH